MRERTKQLKEMGPPGTVSKILWHFTGGPRWNPKKKQRYKSLKPSADAYDALKGILADCKLRVGQTIEDIKILWPELQFSQAPPHRLEGVRDVPKQLNSVQVCCLADIPIAHLAYHAGRYGKFAIGFHRDSVIRSGFNPVFYTLESTRIIRSIFGAVTRISDVNVSGIFQTTEEIRARLPKTSFSDFGLELDLSYIDAECITATEFIMAAQKSFERLLAFIKTFSPDEFGTIYCEREWRSTDTYSFSFDDIAMIVLPKQIDGTEYFSIFTGQDLKELNLPRTVPVVPWEDLIEH